MWLQEGMHGMEVNWKVETPKYKNHDEKEKEKEKRPRVNLILSCGNHTFLISNPQIGPQAFKHTHCISRKKRFF
jgi:hypothetical protein